MPLCTRIHGAASMTEMTFPHGSCLKKILWHHGTPIDPQLLSSLGPMPSSDYLQRLEFHLSLPSSMWNKCILSLVCRQAVKHCYPWQSIQSTGCVSAFVKCNWYLTGKKKGQKLFHSLFSTSSSETLKCLFTKWLNRYRRFWVPAAVSPPCRKRVL